MLEVLEVPFARRVLEGSMEVSILLDGVLKKKDWLNCKFDVYGSMRWKMRWGEVVEKCSRWERLAVLRGFESVGGLSGGK